MGTLLLGFALPVPHKTRHRGIRPQAVQPTPASVPPGGHNYNPHLIMTYKAATPMEQSTRNNSVTNLIQSI